MIVGLIVLRFGDRFKEVAVQAAFPWMKSGTASSNAAYFVFLNRRDVTEDQLKALLEIATGQRPALDYGSRIVNVACEEDIEEVEDMIVSVMGGAAKEVIPEHN